MASVPSCVSSCLVLVLLMLTWRASNGIPVRAPSAEWCQQCSSLFRDLLKNIEELQKNNDLCFGITSSIMSMTSNSDTPLACTPIAAQNTKCLVQRSSSFSETECKKNIMKDLDHYAAAFKSYLEAPLRNPQLEVALLNKTVEKTQNLRKSCSPSEEEEDSSSSKGGVVQVWGNDTFNNRQEMCKMMRGFYARTITINRAVGYICSGDHRK